MMLDFLLEKTLENKSRGINIPLDSNLGVFIFVGQLYPTTKII